MSRLTTKQRRAARFRRHVVESTSRHGAVEFISGMAFVALRLPRNRLEGHGWCQCMSRDAWARGDAVLL